MKKVYNVLVFPGGTEIGLEIHKALCNCKDIHLFSAGLNVPNHAPFVYARHFVAPSIHEPAWIEELNKIITENSIDYIFPAYDDIIVALAQNSDKLKARIVSSPLETCLITRSKLETYKYFSNCLPVPDLYTGSESIANYPVFLKPDRGQGSQNARIVDTKEQLMSALQGTDESIILEYLPGEEYTVDCFSDRLSGLLFCGGRERIRTRSGISVSSRPVHNDIFTDYATKISKKLPFHGAWFFQVKKDRNSVFKLLEVAPRIAGTMALHRVMGVNFPLLSIYEQERIPLTIMKNDAYIEIDRALMNRYKHCISYSIAYIDLDDTLILNNTVNLQVIRFIYQCINKGVKVVLLTKHAEDIDQTLQKYHLHGVFDQVVHINKEHDKSDFIHEKDAILIDDSFSERKAVAEKRCIRTFDCSMLEVLQDDRG